MTGRKTPSYLLIVTNVKLTQTQIRGGAAVTDVKLTQTQIAVRCKSHPDPDTSGVAADVTDVKLTPTKITVRLEYR